MCACVSMCVCLHVCVIFGIPCHRSTAILSILAVALSACVYALVHLCPSRRSSLPPHGRLINFGGSVYECECVIVSSIVARHRHHAAAVSFIFAADLSV